MIDHHDHRKGWNLIGAAWHHIDRKYRLKRRIPVQTESEALSSSGCDQSASVILDISVQIAHKRIRQIIDMRIFQNDTLVFEHPFQRGRCTASRYNLIIASGTVKKRRKIRWVLIHAIYHKNLRHRINDRIGIECIVFLAGIAFGTYLDRKALNALSRNLLL